MNQLVKINQPHLRISHQSEVLILRNQLATLQAEIKEIKHQMNHVNASTQQRKITLSSNGQHHFIALDDILYCKADGNYTKVFIQSLNKENDTTSISSILISKTLKSTIELINSDDLPADELAWQAGFIRCHQSYLINKKHVVGYESSDGLQLKLSNRKSIPVSRRNKKLVLDAI